MKKVFKKYMHKLKYKIMDSTYIKDIKIKIKIKNKH